MKFALITADKAHRVKIQMHPERDDATSFMQWVSIFGGMHLSYEKVLQEGDASLKEFDVVMMSGHLNHIADIIRIGKFLKTTPTITMFYPEGSAQLYDNSINGFHPEYYEAWRACDIVSIAEEDKRSYYEAFVKPEETLVRFIHVPITTEMASSIFFMHRHEKDNMMAVYGDNNPNHPLISMAVANRLNDGSLPEFLVVGVETRNAEFDRIFPGLNIQQISKQPLNPFLRILGKSLINCYPTEWIGTARHQISCAAVGTPCIGNKDSHTQKRLFPELAVDIYDVQKMVQLAKRLITESDFYNHIIRHALNELRYYDMGNTVNRFLKAVNDAYKLYKQGKILVPV